MVIRMAELTKKEVFKKFSMNPKKFYEVELFHEKGFIRKTCEKCGVNFWTLDPDRKTCADAPCQSYDFINDTITKSKLNYIETWKMFEKFFKKNGHTSIPRYPVIDRWRPDLYFTICSIQDFQRLEGKNMMFEYPANPLIVPQMCLRFGDIENVGITGRHLTSFIMSGQHSFNHPNEKGSYFKDRCIDLNFSFLTKEMGIPEKELVYNEDIWAMPDMSAFGPNLETFSRGLELVNSVFMQYQKTSGMDYKELPMKVIDVGWGHERLVWFSNGTPASYDSLFGPLTENMKKTAGIKVDKDIFERYSHYAGALNIDEVKDINKTKLDIASKIGCDVNVLSEEIEPLQSIYAVADHMRTILFAITDGGIPSNVGGGYNLRVLLRRSINFVNKYNLNIDIADIAEQHAKYLKPMFPELIENIDIVRKIINIEQEKYNKTIKNSKKTIRNLIEKNTEFSEKNLATLYESQGITPELIQQVDQNIKIPQSFYHKVTENHEAQKTKEKKKKYPFSDDLKTENLYYSDYSKVEFKAKIISIKDNMIILDKTHFYALSGGQASDKGHLNNEEVIDVAKQGNVMIHIMKNPTNLKIGDIVTGKIDIERRKQITQHHTAAHIINSAAKIVLGKHVWQAGSEKTTSKGRLDITHYDSITKEELDKIEDISNNIVKKDIKLSLGFMERSAAEKKYGFRIYQGSAPIGNNLRIVAIGNHDIEACGGTHVNRTGEVGEIKIIRTTKIQDGVVRIEFMAGNATRTAKELNNSSIDEICATLNCKQSQIPARTEELFSKWKRAKKALRKNKKIDPKQLELTSTEDYEGNPIDKSCEILKSQKPHLANTIKKFKKELDDMKQKILTQQE